MKKIIFYKKYKKTVKT